MCSNCQDPASSDSGRLEIAGRLQGLPVPGGAHVDDIRKLSVRVISLTEQ